MLKQSPKPKGCPFLMIPVAVAALLIWLMIS